MTTATTPLAPSEARRHWTLDPDVSFLNHGSFGACPTPVLEEQQRWRERMERQPVRFFARDIEGLIDEARSPLAAFIGAEARDLAFVSNATAGVNAVLRSLDLRPGDELVTTNHEYNMCRCALEMVARRAGAKLVIAEIPFPISGPDDVIERVLSRVTKSTRLVVVDHVSSQTALLFPIERLVRALEERGVDTLVDAAHSPGLVAIDVERIGAAYYTGNLHKWLCAPKGAAFLHVRRDRQEGIHPTSISHGYDVPRDDRPRLHLEFDWPGTTDVTPWLSVPKAIEFMGSLLPGGWETLRAANRAKALAGRRAVCERLGLDEPAPEEMIAGMASVPLPPATQPPEFIPGHMDPLQPLLLERHGIEIPVIPWPSPGSRVVRLSAQIYNEADEYERLGAALESLLAAGH